MTEIVNMMCLLALLQISTHSNGSAIRKCPAGDFHDDVTDSCGPCSDICLNAKQQLTEERCIQECPNWLGISTPRLHVQDDSKAWIIGLIALVIVGLIAFGVVVKWRKDIMQSIRRRLNWIYERINRQQKNAVVQHEAGNGVGLPVANGAAPRENEEETEVKEGHPLMQQEHGAPSHLTAVAPSGA